MNKLTELRVLVEYQQYSHLKKACLEYIKQEKNPAFTVLLALAYRHLGEKQNFDKTLAKVLAHQALLDVDGLCDLAAIRIVNLQIEQAVNLLQKILKTQPQHALALARLGWCYMAQEQFDKALSFFNRSLAIEERLALYINNAQIHLRQFSADAAQQQLVLAQQLLEQKKSNLPEENYNDYKQRLELQQLQLWVSISQFAQAEQWLTHIRETRDHETSIQWCMHYATQLAEYDQHQLASEYLREALKEASDNSLLLLKLAELSQVQGYYMQAVKLLNRAIKQDENNSQLWVKLSSFCLHRMDKKARHAAEKANELAYALTETIETSDNPFFASSAQLQASAKHALAMVESSEQNYAQAECLFQEILDSHPHFIPALQGFAQQQMQRGRIDEALVLLEQVKQLDPIKGHISLINARQFPENSETLAQLEKAAKLPSIEGPVSSSILFQLAAAWEKHQEYDKAFHFAKQANQSVQRLLNYNAKAHRNACARTRFAFSRALYQHRPNSGISSSLPVYVLGMPRSGTTLVEQIIAGHSQIFGAGELGVIPQVIQGLNRWERHTGSGRCYPDCIDDLTTLTSKGIANNILHELQEYAPDARHIIDKMPHNFENIGLIKFLFPQAKIISVRRDPRDIALSNYFTDYQAKHSGMGFAYDLSTIGEQLADHNLMMQHWQQTFPGEILQINYEDVVDNLEGSARKMLDYIGVDWEPEVLNFNQLERSIKTASVWQVRQPIYKTSKEKWKRYEKYLAPLIKGTNAKIAPDKIDMLTLPEPGFLIAGVELYRQGELDAAEISFKKMLHHNPEHAACHYMLGLVYLSKGYMQDGIELIKKALIKAPWQKQWQKTLTQASKEANLENIDEVLKSYLNQVADGENN